MTQVQNSAAQWKSSNTGANIDWDETSSQSSSDVDVVTVDFDVTGWGTIPGYTSLGLSGWTIIYAAAYLNSDPPGDGGFTWYTDGTMNEANKQADVRTITVHELGHTLALAHDCTPDTQVMCVTWTQKWNVTSDDKNELKAIYGP